MTDVRVGGSDGTLIVQSGRMSNRHGLIAGATGTGKTVTLQVLAEGFSRLGTPVFAVDVKGDLSGISQPGRPHREIDRRLGAMPLEGYAARGYPTLFWDVFGEHGHPVRAAISEIGPLLLANLLELNETQTGVLYASFAVADEQGLLLLDLKDLRAMLAWVGDNARSLRSRFGNISVASVGAIQRRLLVLEEQGAERFFGEPALQIADLMQHDFNGNGVVSLLSADRLLREAPRLYAALLIWLLSELFEDLPEVGDLDAPKLVLFFDEAHLLFTGMPKALQDKLEQVIRLIRSKGVGIYFVTQSPLDLPQTVLGQLGLKIQHALRAFTPADQRAVRAVVDGFRNDGTVDPAATVTTLALGEALVSTLLPDGAPAPVRRTLIAPPESQIGPVGAEQRTLQQSRSPLRGKYDVDLDRESAYEMLAQRAELAQREDAERAAAEVAEAAAAAERASAERAAEKARKATPARSGNSRQSVGEAFIKSAARSIGSALGGRLVRGILGSLLK